MTEAKSKPAYDSVMLLMSIGMPSSCGYKTDRKKDFRPKPHARSLITPCLGSSLNPLIVPRNVPHDKIINPFNTPWFARNDNKNNNSK